MITFDALTLNALKNELSDFIENARISKIQQPTRREFIFVLRNNGKSRQFYVNINPQFYHACFLSKTNYEKRLLEIPQKPPMFCMLLRKYLENSRIAKINQPENERILEFYIESYNELGENIYLCLAFEFMGKHSNVILYNYDTNIIIGCAHNVGAEKSREREIYGSLPYVYPPKQQKTNILKYNGEINYSTLSDEFFMISKSFSNLCVGKSLQDIKNFVQLKNISPCISKDFKTYSLFDSLLSNEEIIKYESVNDMIDDYYAYYIGQNKFELLKTNYKTTVFHKLKKITKTLNQMEYKLLTESDSDKYRLFGDLLMANLYQLKDYSDEVSVFDYENNKQITIRLDNLKTVKENANNFYKLYNKAKSAKTKLTELIEEYNSQKSYFEQLLYSINSAVNIQDLLEISDEVVENNNQNKKNKIKTSEIQKIILGESTTIYIGKNNKQNDYIISKLADEDDLWFHVHNCAGSHVLLKTQNLTDELILQCAKLAKEHSSAKESSKIGVIYTKRKYIRKPPGANLGYVTYRNEKEIIID